MKNKKPYLFIATAVLLALILLAAGLDGLFLSPGQPIDLDSLDYSRWESLLSSVLAPIIIFTLILFLVVVLIVYVPREQWPNLQSIIIIFSVLALIILTLIGLVDIETPVAISETQAVTLVEEEVEPAPVADLGNLSLETAPVRPAWVALAASLLVAGLSVGLPVAALWYFWQQRSPADDMLANIAAEAQIAMDNIQSGDALRDVIIHCYVEMGRVISDMRGIQRREGMTPREFEQRLAALGMPAVHITRLTRLFELARYGLHEASPEERADAVTSLEAIVAACQETAIR